MPVPETNGRSRPPGSDKFKPWLRRAVVVWPSGQARPLAAERVFCCELPLWPWHPGATSRGTQPHSANIQDRRRMRPNLQRIALEAVAFASRTSRLDLPMDFQNRREAARRSLRANAKYRPIADRKPHEADVTSGHAIRPFAKHRPYCRCADSKTTIRVRIHTWRREPYSVRCSRVWCTEGFERLAQPPIARPRELRREHVRCAGIAKRRRRVKSQIDTTEPFSAPNKRLLHPPHPAA